MPSPPGQLDEMLDRWERAGIIDADQGRRIRVVEGSLPTRTSTALRDTVSAPSGTELLAYLSVLVALAGVLTLVYASGARLALVAALTLAVGLTALVGAREFRQRGGATSMRAAGACAALGAAAVGTAAGEFAAALALFTRTVVVGAACAAPGACPGNTSTDQSGNVLLGACVVLVIAMALLRPLPAKLVAIVVIAAAATAVVAALNVAQLSAENAPLEIAALLVGAGAVLVGYAESLPAGPAAGAAALLGFAGAAGAALPLYLVGRRSGVHLDVAGGVVAAAALTAGVVRGRAGIAYGGVAGAAGLVVDIGASNFSTPTSLGVFFSVAGVASVGALVGTTRLLRERRDRAPQPSRG